MPKLVYLCLGIILLAAQIGCKGGAAANANGNANAPANGSIPVNPNVPPPVNPSNPNTPPADTAPGGGPVGQTSNKRSRPGMELPDQIAPAPVDSSGLSFSSMDFHGALMRGNKDQLAALVADDFKGTMLDGSVLNKSQLLAAAKPSEQMFSANVVPPKVTGNSATLTGTMTMMAADPKSTKPGETIKFTDTWQKRGSKWLVTSTKISK